METIELAQIRRDGTIGEGRGELPEAATEMRMMMAELYGKIDFVPPWTGYLAFRGAVAVGVGAFKSPPKGDVVEIAYHTFAAFEGEGIATGIAAQLIQVANAADPAVRVQARTLPEESASTIVLRRNSFAHRGTIDDLEDGEVWLWEFVKP